MPETKEEATNSSSSGTSYYGQLREFNPHISDWSIYKRRMDNYFIVNKISDGSMKRAMLLNALSEEAYQLIYNLCMPVVPEDKSFDELIKLFNQHYKSSESVFLSRSKFYESKKVPEENAQEWAARLRSLATKCEFPENVLDMVLRDKFIMGFGKGTVQERLFEEKADAKFADIVTLAATKMATKPVFDVKMESIQHLPSSKNRSKSGGHLEGHFGSQRSNDKCGVCGRRNHVTSVCRFKNYVCHTCHVKGHLSPVCPKVKQQQGRRLQNCLLSDISRPHCSGSSASEQPANSSRSGVDGIEDELFLLSTNDDRDPIVLDITLDNVELSAELDSGASRSAMSEKLWNKLFKSIPLTAPSVSLYVWHGDKLNTLGSHIFKCCYKNKVADLEIFVVQNGGPTVLGRDFMRLFNLGFTELNHVSDKALSVTALVKKFPNVFSKGLGTFTKGTVRLQLKDDNVQPKFVRARPLPFSMRSKVEDELDRLVKLNVLVPVDFSDWATPIVPVLKSDGTLRICGDFKATLNPYLIIDQYPLPRVEDLFACVAGTKIFSKLDLSQAYNQLLLDETSKELVTISTHKGLFRYQRLPFGVACAPAKFQKIMESLLTGIEGVIVFIDDVLICGKNVVENVERIEQVLLRLQDAGLRISLEKCNFFQEQVKYLGFIIDKDGVHTSAEKVKAINNCPDPTNVTELKSLLGLINYYGKFVPNLSTILEPLHKLLKKEIAWDWNKQCKQALSTVKNCLTSAPVLTLFDPNKTIKLTTDACQVGVGAVIAHIFDNGEEKPIAFASQTLTAAQRAWSQIEREAYAIIFGIKKFHQYLYGREFILECDNKPLIAIFHPSKSIPQYSANRLRRWAVFVSNYQYKLQYVKSEENTADCLSRLPVDDLQSEKDVDYLNYFAENPYVNFEFVKRQIKFDNVLSKILNFVRSDWPNYAKKDNLFKPYFDLRNQLTIEDEVLLWNNRVVIPNNLRKSMLLQLHSSHMGVVKMKSIARSFFYWPGINADIENVAKNCSQCSVHKDNPPKTALSTWRWPEEVFSRIHIDYLGPFLNRHFLIILDAHSKWIEVFPTSNITAHFTITALHSVFARFGIPRVIVSDNATNLCRSKEFQSFLKQFQIEQITSPPFHPQSNGAAENAVKTVKKALKNALSQNQQIDLNFAISNFLFDYRSTVHCTTGVTPSMLMLGRDIRTKFDLLRPDSKIKLRVEQKQKIQSKNFGGRRGVVFVVGDRVYVRDYRFSKPSWIVAKITKRIGKCTYIVVVPELQTTWKRHTNQIRKCIQNGLPLTENDNPLQVNIEQFSGKREAVSPPQVFGKEVKKIKMSTSPNCRPKRIRRAPERLNYT